MTRERTYAVLTGDIVASRKLAPETLRALQERLQSAVEAFEAVFPGTVLGRVGVTRGDGWQAVAQRPERALRLALYLRAVVKAEFSADTRVAIGVGSVERLEPNNVVASVGEAFERSGHGLDALPARRRLAIIGPAGEAYWRVIAGLLDALVTRWSERQAFVAGHSLLNRTQEEIARCSPPNPATGKKPTRQAVAKVQQRIDWKTVEETVRFFEATLKGCDY